MVGYSLKELSFARRSRIAPSRLEAKRNTATASHRRSEWKVRNDQSDEAEDECCVDRGFLSPAQAAEVDIDGSGRRLPSPAAHLVELGRRLSSIVQTTVGITGDEHRVSVG